MSGVKGYIHWRDLGLRERSEIFEIQAYSSDPLMGHRVLCVGSAGCPLWFDVDRVEIEAD